MSQEDIIKILRENPKGLTIHQIQTMIEVKRSSLQANLRRMKAWGEITMRRIPNPGKVDTFVYALSKTFKQELARHSDSVPATASA